MGTGKTAVGQQLAKMLKVPFIDSDVMIEAIAGRSVSEIFTSEGEAAFRRLESGVIKTVAARDQVVIATGGGALVHAENRENLRRHGLLVCLTAKVETLLKRLKDDGSRPLLDSMDRRWHIKRLMEERQKYDAECPVKIATDGETIAAVAKKIIRKLP